MYAYSNPTSTILEAASERTLGPTTTNTRVPHLQMPFSDTADHHNSATATASRFMVAPIPCDTRFAENTAKSQRTPSHSNNPRTGPRGPAILCGVVT
jgi:hypothetical protein